ncbi:hypothetical protein [Nocardiopsis sp. L17-MgMaSL7]|uniref:hypothetical protein n=1 Tax=Nocardiopsis sp. L17-MgMaSL7 TaxID=1938893 RepID=UPI000DA0FBD6|nr:hypothetical protein [Nocardiopsis sp. L17-MgMaSL7]PWV49212.1 hypothetical protein BDW27_10966 [Nocardiopsis sp. L17-MgMaSL7]
MNHPTQLTPDSVVEAVARTVAALGLVLDHHPLTTQAHRALTYAHNDLTGPYRYTRQTLDDVGAALSTLPDLDALGDDTRTALDPARQQLAVAAGDVPGASVIRPAPNVAVLVHDAELPARYPLMLRSQERHGLLFICLVFNARQTTAARARWVQQAAERGTVLSAELADQIAEEITRRGAQAVNR